MCGIVGYVGEREALPIILNSLQRIEYRGYDSCGILVQDNNEGKIHVHKSMKSIAQLKKNMSKSEYAGTLGIGHTRWATHGVPSRRNAHPHFDCDGEIAVVHNGIIENFQALKEGPLSNCRFKSDTDTEVIPHLIHQSLEKFNHQTSPKSSIKDAVRECLSHLRGSYAIIATAKGFDGLVAARKESPLIIGVGDRENFIASDVPAVLEQTNRVIYLEEGDLAVVKKDSIYIENKGSEVKREVKLIPWTIEDAEKGGYEHFMLKEIHEEPRTITDTLRDYLVEDEINFGVEFDADSILLIACGSSSYAALYGKYIIEHIAKIPVRIEVASEFNYSDFVLDGSKVMVMAITQSGETADTLMALKKAKRYGCKTVAITNVLGSSVTRIADHTLYTKAGPEISVVTTKSFIAQLIILCLTALFKGKKEIERKRFEKYVEELKGLPEVVLSVLAEEEEIKRYGDEIGKYEHVFVIGRGINYPVALEGAIKLKETAYIHGEGYAAGELKHGPFALLTEDTPVIAILTRDAIFEKTLVNVKEIKARGAPVIAIAEEGDEEIEKYVDGIIRVPRINPILSPIPNTTVLQLLSYYAARERGCEIDKPRNLAKSVTVE